MAGLINWGALPPFVYHPEGKTAPWIIESWARSQVAKDSWYLMAKLGSEVLTLLRGSLKISLPQLQ